MTYKMRLSDFDYILPKELIAQYPRESRDKARLLVVERSTGVIAHAVFSSLGDYLRPADLLVLNDTRVLPARLIGRRGSGGRVEALLLEVKNGTTFAALLKPARLKLNERISFEGGKLFGVISAKNEISFEARAPEDVFACGRMPLPPYIKREAVEADRQHYQTVYAKIDGAIASPTAGLHFTVELMDELRSRGSGFAYITLHVGAGTFKPVKSDDITSHRMSAEYFEILDETKSAIACARSKKARVVAVGTTSLRALEAQASAGCSSGYTDLFIYPGYKFKAADCLMTNFHLPRTTLFMLACAFGGMDLIKEAYRRAIEQKYLFYSYGDAMLIL